MWFLDKKIYQLDFLQQQIMHHCMATSSLKANIYCPKTDFLPPGKCKLWEDSSERRFIINLHTDLPINFYRLHRLVIRGISWSIWDFLRPFHQNLRPESKATEMWSHFFVLGILENSRSDATNVVFSGSESNYDYFKVFWKNRPPAWGVGVSQSQPSHSVTNQIRGGRQCCIAPHISSSCANKETGSNTSKFSRGPWQAMVIWYGHLPFNFNIYC